MTRAEIQTLIDAGGEFVLPFGGHYLDGPLVMLAGAYVSLGGGTLVKAFDGDGPLVTASAPFWSLRNGKLQNGGVAVDGSYFFALENLQIDQAPCAYNARGAAWMGKLDRVYATLGGDGFQQVDGTTMTFTNCFANRCGGKAWNIENVYELSLRACAADNNAGQAVRFYACDGMVIDGWYMEADRVPGCTFMLFDSCRGVINGLESIGAVLSADAGKGATLVQVNKGRIVANGLLLGGSPKRNPDTASGAGSSEMLLVTEGAVVVLTGSEIYHADKASGAGPAYTINGAFVDGGGNAL